jgi:hypothetical protein
MYGTDLNRLAETIYLDYLDAARTTRDSQRMNVIGAPEFKMALLELRDMHLTKLRVQLYESVRYRPEFAGNDLAELRKWVRAVLHRDDETVLAVLAHHIANIKRKMAGLPVQWHLMPIFSGPQGIGKTVAVKQLYSPLGHTFTERTLTSSLNEFSQHFVERYFAVLFDEMAGIDRQDINALKRLITSEGGSFRKAHSPENSEYENRASFIGTTNESAELLLKDSSGARRFFEIKVEEQTDHAALGLKGMGVEGTINYQRLWQEIDELSANKYYEKSKTEIQEQQKLLAAPNALQEFMIEHEAIVESPDFGTYVLKNKLYQAYAQWAKDNVMGYTIPGTMFPRHLRAFGCETKNVIARIDGKAKKYQLVKVSSEHKLPAAFFESDELLIRRLLSSIQVVK